MEDNKNNTKKRVKEFVKMKEPVKFKTHDMSKDILSMTGHTYTYNGSVYGEIINKLYRKISPP